MFKFGFSSEENTDNDIEVTPENDLKWLECRQILPEIASFQRNYNPHSIQCENFTIKYVSDKDVNSSLENTDNDVNSLIKAEQNHSDLITGVYEGGLKIWECTFDLLNFLSRENLDLKNSKVLDLGCGAGIIGIYSGIKGAFPVFQDYNGEVIQNITIPNVFLNKIDFDKCSFYCGDWGSFLSLKKLSENEKFDYIFTSETIYNVNNYKKLFDIFQHMLKKSGIIYLAAKCHYFGVGGGIRQFEDMLKKEDIFDHMTCWVCPNGVKREIIKITFKK